MQVWNVLHAARWKYRTQKIAKNSPSGHHRTILSGHIFATKVRRVDSWKKELLNSNISSTCPPNMANFGPLTAEIGSGVSGTPADFNGFRGLPSLLQRRRSPDTNQTFTMFGRLLDLYIIYTFSGSLLLPDGILPRAKFTLRPTLAFSYIGSVTARHSSSGH